MDQPPRPGSPLRRLRACVPCTKAKARCNFREENNGRHLCDRCERLKIDCAAKTTRSFRRARQLKPLVNRVASLEQQIASLVTTERAQNAHPHASITSSSSNSKPPQLYGRDPRCDDPGDSWPGSDDQMYSDVELAIPSTKPPFGLTWTQAAFALNDFRTHFTPNFPFVVVDPDMTPQHLLRERPFLFRAIMLVAAPLPLSRVAKMQRQVLAYLGQRMLLEEEETLELLQGILVIIMWGDTKYFYDRQITRLVYTALGYAHSLGITKVPLSVVEEHCGAEQPDDCFAAKIASTLAKHHTLEEQRAFLGCFYAVTVNSNQFARRNPLLQQLGVGTGRGLLHIDVCCENLARSGRPEDTAAAAMVRLAQISGRIAEIFGSLFNRATGDSYATLFEVQAVAIRREVDKIAEQIDFRDPLFSYLWMQYNTVLAQLYEPATRAATSTPLHRTTCLLGCLAAARAYYDALAALPPERFLYRTSSNITDAQIVVTITTHLLVLDAEGWDLATARASLDFLDVAERMTDMFRGTVAAGRQRMRRFADETGVFVAGEEEGESRGGMCEELVQKMTYISEWYQSKTRTRALTAGGEAANTELVESLSKIWYWPSDTSGFSFFAGLLNPLDVSYEGI